MLCDVGALCHIKKPNSIIYCRNIVPMDLRGPRFPVHLVCK